MRDRLDLILGLLDEGLRLYRRHFGVFALIAAGWFVPLVIVVGILAAVGERLEPVWAVLAVLGLMAVMLPATIYMLGGLSRAALAAASGEQVRLREALAIRPARAAGVGCFALVYSVAMQAVSSALSLICICPLWFIGFGAAALFGQALDGSGAAPAGLALIGVLISGVYLFLIMVGGAGYSSLIYALQPLMQSSQPFGDAISESLSLVGYRLGRNLIAWGISALLVVAVGLVVTVAIGVLVPLPLTFALGEESRLAQAVAGVAWMAGLVVVIPPLPIWMALLYRANAAERQGSELEARVREWLNLH
jgi:hypothetical protein